ncbi:Biopolymer transport protein ExbD/TolR [Desulfurobacterium thermolithotrophum DSM 11699]|uniref:Biopolymer transport protein ExbD/TolR n=1 Tax=Desulfurobacterium thermolithotrophum (strain DSM 11699 / BSA) TaxID=868864 RepID=F0S3K6_DESTD|nr:biopolymer transporter ExbD [Desulfurobacterium thermolithotrophum]ADY73428.1 Biopolymer transport protein ExbD/TolR [Desulfurobacterium thermolithotrophum DSM 11699]
MCKFKDEPVEEKPQLIIVPMVDVMLFLLAFFVLIAGSIIPGLAIKTNPPETTQKTKVNVKKEIVTITIKKDGSIYFKEKKVSLKDLKRLLKEAKRKNPVVSVAINADRDSKVQLLVSVMDTAQEVGINSIGLIAKEKNEGNR